MFNPPNCREEQRVKINRFSKMSQKWESQKFKHLNGCELVVFRIELSRYVEVYNVIAPTLNITTNWTFDYGDEIGKRGEGKFDLFFVAVPMRMAQQFSYMEIRFVPSRCITFSDQTLIVSRSAPFTIAEKALMPLDADVWYWLIGFVGFGVGVIIVMNFARIPIRNFVIGRNVGAPLLNLM
jgi:hypothetical protein